MNYYHGSKSGEIKMLDTEHSKDGYVYVTSNRLVALAYAARTAINLFGTLRADKKIVVFREYLPDFLRKTTDGVSGYIYTLEEKEYEPIKINDHCAFCDCYKVKGNVRVVKREFILNLYEELMKYCESGEFVYRKYEYWTDEQRLAEIKQICKAIRGFSDEKYLKNKEIYDQFLEEEKRLASKLEN